MVAMMNVTKLNQIVGILKILEMETTLTLDISRGSPDFTLCEAEHCSL